MFDWKCILYPFHVRTVGFTLTIQILEQRTFYMMNFTARCVSTENMQFGTFRTEGKRRTSPHNRRYLGDFGATSEAREEGEMKRGYISFSHHSCYADYRKTAIWYRKLTFPPQCGGVGTIKLVISTIEIQILRQREVVVQKHTCFNLPTAPQVKYYSLHFHPHLIICLLRKISC